MSLAITLTATNQTFDLPKEWLLQTLPDSILSEAIRTEPDVTTLALTEPSVTPLVMQTLVEFSQGKEPTKHLPELATAHRYLNIAPMVGYADPLYEQIPHRQDTTSRLNKAFLLNEILRGDRLGLYTYFERRGLPVPKERAFIRAIRKGAIQIVRHMMPTVQLGRAYLREAVETKSVEMFKLLDSDSRINLTSSDSLAPIFTFAVECCASDIVGFLLDNYHAQPTLDLLTLATQHGNIEIVQRFLEDARINPAESKTSLMLLAAAGGYFDIVKLYLDDKRMDHATPCRETLYYLSKQGQVELVKQLLQKFPSLAVAPIRGLQGAIKGDCLAIVEMLSPLFPWVPSTALSDAIRRDRTEIVKYFLSTNLSENERQQMYTFSCRHGSIHISTLIRATFDTLPPVQAGELGEMVPHIDAKTFAELVTALGETITTGYNYIYRVILKYHREDLLSILQANIHVNPTGLSPEQLDKLIFDGCI